MEKPKTTARVRHGCTSWIVAPLMSYPRNTYRSWILTPLWVVQLILLAFSILAIGVLCFEVQGEGYPVNVGWIVALAFVFICILLTATEIGLWFVRALHPWTFLGIQVFKTTFWVLYVGIGIATTVVQRVMDSNLVWPVWKWLQVACLATPLLVTIAALIYASILAHTYRTSGLFLVGASDTKTYREEHDSEYSDVPYTPRENSRDGRV